MLSNSTEKHIGVEQRHEIINRRACYIYTHNKLKYLLFGLTISPKKDSPES